MYPFTFVKLHSLSILKLSFNRGRKIIGKDDIQVMLTKVAYAQGKAVGQVENAPNTWQLNLLNHGA